MTLLYDQVVVGTVEGAFISDGTWFGEFFEEPQTGTDQSAKRVSEFIRFCREWHVRLAEGADHDAAEFDQFSDLLSSGLWKLKTPGGLEQTILEAPVFIGTEITWTSE